MKYFSNFIIQYQNVPPSIFADSWHKIATSIANHRLRLEKLLARKCYTPTPSNSLVTGVGRRGVAAVGQGQFLTTVFGKKFGNKIYTSLYYNCNDITWFTVGGRSTGR